MYHHVASPCASHVEANSDISKMENSDRHWFSDHLGAGKVISSRHCKFKEPIHNIKERRCCCHLLSSFEQTDLQTVRFVGTPLGDVSK